MTQEHLILLLPPIGWILWGVAGAGWPPFRKNWRRWIWPLYVGVIALLMNHPILLILLGVGLGVIAHSLGYGERHHLLWRGTVALALGAWTLAFGAAWGWALFIAGWFAGMYALSRRYNNLTWRWVESSTGLWQGVALVRGLS